MTRLTRVTLLIAAALVVAPHVFADGDPATDTVPRLLPYQGVLELDGQPVNARGEDALHIGFALFAGVDAELPVYRQDLQVEVFAGRFTATIGPTGLDAEGNPVPVDRVISAADDLYLGMVLLGDPADPEDDIPLANRQRIHASPYAMWTTSATDLNVARDLLVGRNATIGGNLSVGGALTVDGPVALSPGAINTGEIADGAIRPGKVALGGGLAARGGDTLGVDNTYLDARIRSWVRSHCRIEIGHRDRCSGCGSPSASAAVRADRTCISGCRNSGWGGVRFTGDVDGNDDMFVRFTCD